MTNSADLRVSEVDPNSFHLAITRPRRFFNGEIGIPVSSVIGLKNFKPDVILVRGDGWSVCCDADQFQTTYNLYPNEWEKMIAKRK